MNINDFYMSWKPLIYTIIFAIAWVAFLVLEIQYRFKQQNKQSTSLKEFVEETVNSIEDAITSISTKNKRPYHVRWALWRQWNWAFWDIDFDISISIGKDNQISVTNVETGIWASLQEKINSTHRIKFALSSTRKDEIHQGINQ